MQYHIFLHPRRALLSLITVSELEKHGRLFVLAYLNNLLVQKMKTVLIIKLFYFSEVRLYKLTVYKTSPFHFVYKQIYAKGHCILYTLYQLVLKRIKDSSSTEMVCSLVKAYSSDATALHISNQLRRLVCNRMHSKNKPSTNAKVL